jgi:Ni/Co efflux regulator RcnB
LLISTAFAGLLAFSPAWGQDRDDNRDQHARPAPAAHAAPPPRPAAQPRQTAQPRPQMGGKFDQNLNRNGAPAARNAPAARTPSQPAPRDAMRGHAPNNPGTAMRGPAAPRNFTAYQRNFNAPRRFHAAAYHQPRGWYARRWTYGQILPALFWTPDFWLNDFGDYGLQPPPPGTVWVRDGGDAILIDRFSGEIIQVDYGVFY